MIPRPRKACEFSKEINIDFCLAKTDQIDSCNVPGMTVFQHCRATGLVAEALAAVFPLLDVSGLFIKGYDLIASLHDIGKISPSFQKKIGNALGSHDREMLFSNLGLEGDAGDEKIHHSTISYAALKSVLGEYIAYIEGSHHGGLLGIQSGDDEVCGGKVWQEARMRLLSVLQDTFGRDVPRKLSEAEVQFLLGLTIISDWISSSVSLQEYSLNGDSIFAKKVRAAGFVRHKYRQGLSFQDIFGFSMRSEQQAFIESIKGPGVYILEAGMGSGKTEAALYASYLLLSSGQSDGLYFALPTRFTAREMHMRVARFLAAILEDENADAKLIFSQSFLYSLVYGDAFHEPSWFDSRKRLILAPFGVGTIDQAIMSVLCVKHSAVRTFGLAGKVVIIDEVHSYDAYTGTLISRLIEQLKELHATVIILSATLRKKAKSELFSINPSLIKSDAYPCITRQSAESIFEQAVESQSSRRVRLECVHDDEMAFDEAIGKAIDGNYVLWIENTVTDAQKVYRKIAARCKCFDFQIGLLHSRFTGSDRSRKEKEYVKVFGKDGWNERDGRGFILIGTQILEQSLDIDADVLFTRIAPADMLLQRMGRVWRHKHPERKGQPECFVLTPEEKDVYADPDVFRKSGAVYSRYVLYRTLLEIEGRTELILPDDIRSIIEAVYSERSEKDRNIQMFVKELEDRKRKLTGLARIMGNRIGKFLSDDEAPRYSDLKSRDILLLAKVSPKWTDVWLHDGTHLDLAAASSPREKAIVSLKLEENIISVPARYCPSLSPVDRECLLSRFIYLADEPDERLCVLLCPEGIQLDDISGNRIPECFYSSQIGYYMKEEDR